MMLLRKLEADDVVALLEKLVENGKGIVSA